MTAVEALAAALAGPQRLLLVETDDELHLREVLHGAGRQSGRPLSAWDLARAEASVDPYEALLAAIDGAPRGAALLVLDGGPVLADRRLARRLLHKITGGEGPTLVFAGDDLAPHALLLPHARLLTLQPPDMAASLRRAAQRLGADARLGGSDRGEQVTRIRRLVRLLHGLSLAAFDATCARIQSQDPALGDEALSIAREARREQVRALPYLSVSPDPPGPDSLGGLDALKTWLRDRARAAERAAEGRPLPAPRGILLAGVPGCGKSLAAQISASVFGVPLLRLELGGLRGGSAGPEQRLLRGLREAERAAPCVLWLDEIDHAVRDADKRAENHGLVGTLASWLQEHRAPVFVAATANHAAALPPELGRKGRFDEIFFVDLPHPGERAEILAVHCAAARIDATGLETAALVDATRRFTGAEVAAVVREGAIAAALAGEAPSSGPLRDAASRLVPMVHTYEREIDELREWARSRARPTTTDPGVLGFFEEEG